MKGFFPKSPQTGFTLMELLVVISIISLLSSIVMASLASAKIRARDTKRIMEMKEIQNALNLYYSNHGEYPIPSYPVDSPPFFDNCGSYPSLENTLSPLLNEKLISAIPNNAIGSTVCSGYNHGKNLSSEDSSDTIFSCGGKVIKNTDYILIFKTEKTVNFPKLLSDELFVDSSYNDYYCLTP